jgi:hypothetical protein
MAGPRPLIALSLYNHQELPHEVELTRRRHLVFERSHRAAAEALQALRSGRTQEQVRQEKTARADEVIE